MAFTLKDGSTVHDRRLDRIAAFDRRSLQFPVSDVLNADQQNIVTQLWAAPDGTPVLDQGREGACFTGDVMIMRADGSYQQIQDIRLLDEVVTAEGRTGVVTHLFVRKADQGLVNVDIDGHIPLRCTPEHPVLTARGYIAASELQPGDLVAITKRAADTDEPLRPASLIDMSEFSGVLSGEVNTGGVLTRVTPVPELVARTPALGRLIGLYAAEGHTTVNKVVWSYGSHEEHTLAAETVALLKTVFDAESRVQIRPNGATNVVLYGKAWRRLFETLVPGTSKHGTKCLSAHVTAGPDEYRRAILDGWIAGDGYQRRTEVTGVTVSRHLALDMHAIANSLGLRPRVRVSEPSLNRHAATRQPRYDFGYGVGGGSARSAKQDSYALWRKVRGVRPEAFEGYVYNIEVEGDHSYVADGVGVHNCVGFGTTHELLWNPVPVPGLDATFAREKIYWVAQENDPWPGGSYPSANPVYEGTSVLYGVKAAADLGYYTEYRWATSETEMARAVSYLGPAIIGVDWYEGMFEPDSKGYIHATGDKMGGHCCLVIGVNVDTPTGKTTRKKNNVDGYYTIHNSWGPGWGDNGNCKISRADMRKLLGDNGECCIITGRTMPQPTKSEAVERADDILH